MLTYDKKIYNEVLEVLNHIPEQDYNKIPKDLIQTFQKNKDEEYIFKLEEYVPFEKQDISYDAKVILAILFRDYWATEIQREKIIARQNYDIQKKEEEKRKAYNPDDIFGSKIVKEQTKYKETRMTTVKEEKWYKKIFNLIKELYLRKK